MRPNSTRLRNAAAFGQDISARWGGRAPPSLCLSRKSSDGINISKLEPVNKAIELWKVRFADSQSLLVEHENISKPNLPLLWISEENEELDARIIRGIQNQGFC